MLTLVIITVNHCLHGPAPPLTRRLWSCLRVNLSRAEHHGTHTQTRGLDCPWLAIHDLPRTTWTKTKWTSQSWKSPIWCVWQCILQSKNIKHALSIELLLLIADVSLSSMHAHTHTHTFNYQTTPLSQVSLYSRAYCMYFTTAIEGCDTV